MKIKKYKPFKGFTIIELIVVVAIMAVLATIVATNVIVYIDKGKNAAIKGNMANLQTYGITYYSDHSGSYNNFCNDAKVLNFQTAINQSANPETSSCTCDTANCTNAGAWCVIVQIRESEITSGASHPKKYCVDSTGYRKDSSNASFACTDGVCVGG